MISVTFLPGGNARIKCSPADLCSLRYEAMVARNIDAALDALPEVLQTDEGERPGCAVGGHIEHLEELKDVSDRRAVAALKLEHTSRLLIQVDASWKGFPSIASTS